MSDLDDLQYDPASAPVEGPPPRRSGLAWVAVVALVAVAAGLGWYLWQRSDGGRPAEEGERPAAGAGVSGEAPPAAELEEEIELPPLDASDALVRELARLLSTNPDLAAWLATDRLIRRVTAVVVNVAEGESPAPHVRFLGPDGSFTAEEDDGALVAAPDSYRRYDRLAAAFDSLDPQGVARFYRKLEPLFDQAYRDLGYPGGRFRQPLGRAIGSLLATPVPPDRLDLEAGVASYRFRRPEYERLTPAQKHLVRMGPRNIRLIQAELRQIAAALDLEVAPADPGQL